MMQEEDVDRIEPRQNEAREWVIRLVPGNATVADLERFRQWSSLDPENARAFAEAQRVWRAMEPAGRNVFKRHGAPTQATVRFGADRRFGRRAILGAGLAAAAAAAYAVIYPPLDLWPSLVEVFEADYRTGIGERRKLALSGNVSLEMNTRTSVALRPKQGDIDRIELIAGESVITTNDHAFKVVAGPVQAEASDASFNIRHDGASVCVTCLSGAVKITGGLAAVSLGAHQQVSYSETGLGDVITVDPSVITAWQSGALIFHDTPLSEVVAEANRYRPGRIVVANAELSRQLVNARFRLDRLDDVVTKLAGAFGATTTSLPGGVIVLQ